MKETIFTNRFMAVPELNRMGADIKIIKNIALINGEKKFFRLTPNYRNY